MENFTWDAVPSQRQRKTEKYTYPVMTMAALTKSGAGRKFSFNKASQGLLDIEGGDRISFGFNNDRTIVAIRKSEEDRGFKLTKSCTFSDKKTFEFISKTLKLNNEIENEFRIVENTGYYSLQKLDYRAEIKNIDQEYTLNSDLKDEDCDACEEEKELELTPSEDVNNETW